MVKLEISGASLKTSQDTTVINLVPLIGIGIITTSLYQTAPKVELFYVNQGISFTFFNQPLNECVDSGGTEFTVETILQFASDNFGVASASSTNPIPIVPSVNSNGTGGLTPFKLISEASTNATSVKASGGNLYNIVAIGLSSTVYYLKLYNKASAPNVGVDVPILTIPIPTNTQGGGVSIPIDSSINFALGIALALTSGSADNDSGVVGAGEVVINLLYA
jgi:hypothetical protein